MIINFIVGLLFVTAAFAEPLQIDSVSTFADSISSSLSGSLRGGRTIYINGLGFDPIAQNNVIFVGDYPCEIPAEGVTTNFLICETTDTGSDGDKNSQTILVIANGQIALGPKTFSYKNSDTPTIYDVFPSTSFAGDRLYFYGVHRVVDYGNGERDMGDFRGLYIGDSLCSMFDISQSYINYNGYKTVKCDQAALQEAGRYMVKEHVIAGYAKKSYKMLKTENIGLDYEHTVLAAIDSISTHEGLIRGQDITITGTGFSANPSRISISVDTVPCDVISSSITEITCHLQENDFSSSSLLESENATTQVDGYISGAGFAYQRYSVSANQNFAGFKALLDSGSHSMTLKE